MKKVARVFFLTFFGSAFGVLRENAGSEGVFFRVFWRGGERERVCVEERECGRERIMFPIKRKKKTKKINHPSLFTSLLFPIHGEGFYLSLVAEKKWWK